MTSSEVERALHPRYAGGGGCGELSGGGQRPVASGGSWEPWTFQKSQLLIDDKLRSEKMPLLARLRPQGNYLTDETC